jgi:murein tripeptide amidase MpaA
VRGTGKLRVLIQGNIHGGEVEGKESAQILLREIAEGKHADWLRSIVLLVAPIYNADGNERIAPTNRQGQHGPIEGSGQRPNAQNLNINRDYMKLRHEARSMVWLLNDDDPHIMMDSTRPTGRGTLPGP